MPDAFKRIRSKSQKRIDKISADARSAAATQSVCGFPLHPASQRNRIDHLHDFESTRPKILIPVLVTGIQPDQVLGRKERFPRRRRGAALISVTSTEMRRDCRRQNPLERQRHYPSRSSRHKLKMNLNIP
ncbi:hypothetical protein GOA89_21285 [Sinorhizobium meliloti]|nr:hypothetical protein [Sinorhizobium meliloti]MDW9848800.1 hypothetical protein [Sinorhizobium meliloti]MDX0145329.1 hypothetical protein [Sinorhizobium meliloti]MDX0152242.1 hypothetical protein [Sinorhizobium meliloti]MDX0170680.1 hypothetical protein [Sinorhizobium meliloti]